MVCSFVCQRFVRCSFIRRFISGSDGSLWLICLMLFLSLILAVIVFGSGVWFELILPFCILCLSAERIALVMILLAMWGFVGVAASLRIFSISKVKLVQFALE